MTWLKHELQVSSKSRFVTLDGLRGISAVAVAIYHLNPDIVPSGYLAVDLFFVISGFILARNYENRFKNNLSISDFLRQRITRIYPMYLIGHVFSFGRAIGHILYPHDNKLSTFGYISSFILGILILPYPNDFSGKLYPINTPSWSLLLELIANILMAIFLIKFNNKKLLLFSLFSWIILIIFCAGAQEGIGRGNINTPIMAGGSDWGTLHIGIVRTSFSFSVGILIWRGTPNLSRIYSKYSLLILAAIALIFFCSTSKSHPYLVDLIIITLFFPIIVLLSIRLEVPKNLSFIPSKLGDASFSTYTMNETYSALFKFIEKSYFIEKFYLIPLFSFICTLISIILMKYLEAPIRTFLQKTLIPKMKKE